MEKYNYKGIDGFLIEIREVPNKRPKIKSDVIGFYRYNDVIEDILNGVAHPLLCYDDLIGGGYCGGSIVLAIIKDTENDIKSMEFISNEYALKNENIIVE